MADSYASLAMALPKDEIPERLECLEDLIPLYKDGASLHSISRKNWLIYAVEECAAHYRCPRLAYLSPSASVLSPAEATLAAEEITTLLKTIERDPASLSRLLGQDAWPDDEIVAMLQVEPSPWGPLVDSDDGDDLPYLVSFLVCQNALLRHAAEHNLHFAFAQTAPSE